MSTEVWIINGHREDCAYIRSLDDLDGYDQCDCGSDDDDGNWDDDDYYVDGDYGW